MNTTENSAKTRISPEERARLLAVAGNPLHGQVEPLASKPGCFRVCIRIPRKETHSKNATRRLFGVIVGDEFLTAEQYHRKFTRRGNLRVILPEGQPRRPRGRPRRNTVTVMLPNPANDASAATTAPKADPESAFYKNADAGVLTRMLDAVPILYRTAENCGLVSDLCAAYGNDTFAAEILSVAMFWIIDKNNVSQRFPWFSRSHALPFLGQMQEYDLCNMFSALGSMETQLFKLFDLRMRRLPAESRINYDSTTIPTSARDACFAQVSFTKEGTLEALEHFSLLVDQKTHQPVMFQVVQGRTPDCKTVSDLCHRLREIAANPNNLMVCDRGYETLENLMTLDDQGRHYLMAVRSLNQQDIASAIDTCITKVKEPTARHVIPGTEINGMTIPATLRHEGRTLHVWLHVFYDHRQAADKRAALLQRLNDFEALWNSKTEHQRYDLLSDPLRQKYYVRPRVSEMRQPLQRNLADIDYEIDGYGVFANVSNIELSTAQAYDIYRHRDIIEKVFQMGKTGLKIDTARAHRQDTLDGRFVVAFVALTIISELTRQLGQPRELPDRRCKPLRAHTYSVSDVINRTSGIALNYGIKDDRFWLTGVYKDLPRICAACGTADVYERVPPFIYQNRMELARYSKELL